MTAGPGRGPGIAAALVLACATGFGGPALAAPPAWLVRARAQLDQPLSRATRDLRWLPLGDGSREPQRELPVARREVAVRGLRYLGLQPDLRKFAPLARMPGGVAGWLAGEQHVYQLGGRTWIVARQLGVTEQLTVAAVARAVALLARDHPGVHRWLLALDDPCEDAAALERVIAGRERGGTRLKYVNLTVGRVIALDPVMAAPADNVYWLGTPRTVTLADGRQLEVYRNLAAVRIGVSAIQASGSRQIYATGSWRDDLLWWLREAVVDALVHEALHNRISAEMHRDPRFAAIRRCARLRDAGGVGPFAGKIVEELIVAASSVDLFGDALEPPVRRYYAETMPRFQLDRLRRWSDGGGGSLDELVRILAPLRPEGPGTRPADPAAVLRSLRIRRR